MEPELFEQHHCILLGNTAKGKTRKSSFESPQDAWTQVFLRTRDKAHVGWVEKVLTLVNNLSTASLILDMSHSSESGRKLFMLQRFVYLRSLDLDS